MTDERPLLRPYTLTRGRTRPTGPDFDLVTIVRALPASNVTGLPPEQLRILRACQSPASVADIASDVGLSLNVVRVLLGDLRELRLIAARPPATVAQLPEERILREVIQGLHAL
ncbi:DUF742 domain-containing protein [Acrocarpospora macrocephala]|uniref:DUF742 domain-containing protein n=2 Tax=Acrocarpospora TaxID=90974 RepID=A0A5M3Y151_9ACTN|nr:MULTISPECIES: DUF742 domain-containing protein [Acrocarpospora]GES08121.1 hypothetical protein Amac_017160 [Acrocarpospora macrocephala]GES25899.1 hypothetical protein Aple_087980 [Acrocarpospora pleiomorpha]